MLFPNFFRGLSLEGRRSKRGRKAAAARRVRPTLETLEHRLTPAVTITEFPVSAYVGGGIAAGPDDALWCTSVNDVIYRITTAGVTNSFSNGITSYGVAITGGPDGNVWFMEQRGAIGQITPAGVVTEFTAGLSPGAQPANDTMTAGPDGNVWFTENAYPGGGALITPAIGRITPAGVITEFPVPTFNVLDGITTGPDGDLWFTEQNGIVGKIDPNTGAVTEFSIGSNETMLGDIATGSDGNLWFIIGNHGDIGRITPAGAFTEFSSGISAGAYLAGLTAGPDGNIWFTEYATNKIGQITPAGVVTEFSGATANSGMEGITAGPDGNLWFTEPYLGSVGRVSSTVPLIVTTPTDENGGGTLANPYEPDGTLSLRDAIALAELYGGAQTITFDPTVFATPQTIQLSSSLGSLVLNDPASGAAIEIDGRPSRCGSVNADKASPADSPVINSSRTAAMATGETVMRRLPFCCPCAAMLQLPHRGNRDWKTAEACRQRRCRRHSTGTGLLDRVFSARRTFTTLRRR